MRQPTLQDALLQVAPVASPVVYDARLHRGHHVAEQVAAGRVLQQVRALRGLCELARPLRGLEDGALALLLRRRMLRLDARQRVVPHLAGGSEAGLYAVFANGITTGTALKTLVEVISGANVAPTVFQWHCEFNASAAAAAILVELLRATGSFTGGTAVTPTLLQPGRKAVQSTCNSGIAGAVNTTEGTRGAVIEQHYIPPTSGLLMQYPLAREPEIAVSDRARISATAAAAVSAAVGIQFSE